MPGKKGSLEIIKRAGRVKQGSLESYRDFLISNIVACIMLLNKACRPCLAFFKLAYNVLFVPGV